MGPGQAEGPLLSVLRVRAGRTLRSWMKVKESLELMELVPQQVDSYRQAAAAAPAEAVSAAPPPPPPTPFLRVLPTCLMWGDGAG